MEEKHEKGSVNAFANDGSFMEMFRRKMAEEKLRSGSSEDVNRPATGAGVGTELSPAHDDHDALTVPHKAGQSDDRTRADIHPERAISNPESAGCTKSGNSGENRLSASTESPDLRFTRKDKDPEQEQTVSKSTVPDDQPAVGVGKPVTTSVPSQKKYSLLSHVGKRRDGKLSLKTGTVKKQRNTEPQDQDSWSKYMAEVQKYKAHVCGDEDKSRPLVK